MMIVDLIIGILNNQDLIQFLLTIIKFLRMSLKISAIYKSWMREKFQTKIIGYCQNAIQMCIQLNQQLFLVS